MKITKKLKEWSDEEALNNFYTFLTEGRVIVTAGLVRQKDGLITHQMVRFSCGDYVIQSDPEEIGTPLVVATAKDLGLEVH